MKKMSEQKLKDVNALEQNKERLSRDMSVPTVNVYIVLRLWYIIYTLLQK